MNHRFLPNREKEIKPGIMQNKHLVSATSKSPHNEKIKQNIPSNWIYNDQKTEKMWEDLERYQKKREKDQNNNPFVKIDESTERIKNVIDKYEKEDEDLYNKMAEYSFGDPNDPGDEESMLLDARLKLTGILDDHSDNQQKQSALLAGLRYWLEGVKGGGISELPDFLKTEESSYNIDMQKVVEALEGISQSKNEIGERATETFKAAFNILTKKLEEANQKVQQQSLQIRELQTISDKRGPRKSLNRSSDKNVSIDELVRERNRNATLEAQIKQLRELQQQQPKSPESPEKSETNSNLESVVQAELKANNLEESVKRLKEETKYLQSQIFKMKRDELANAKKMTSLENHKESLEKSLKNATDKLKLYEGNNNDLLKNQENDKKANLTKSDYEKKLSDMKLQHLKEIDEIREQNNQRINKIMKDNDRKMEEQMRIFADGMSQQDGSSILKNAVKMYTDQLEELRNTSETKIEDNNKKNKEAIQNVIERYESILKLKDDEMQRNKAEFTKSIQILEKKNELDTQERINQELLNLREQTTKEFQDMKGELDKKVSELKLKLKSVQTERDTLKHIIEENMLEMNDEEDENENDLIEKSDKVLNETMQQLKLIELEKKLEEKYTLLMQTQRSILEETKSWEIDAIKKSSDDEISQKVSEVRRRIADLTRRDILAIKGTDQQVMQHFTNVLKIFEKDNPDLVNSKQGLMMPAEEVEFKMNEYREKLLQVLNENETWKMTFNKLDTIKDKSELEILEALKKAIADQSKEYAVLKSENENLRNQIISLVNDPQLASDLLQNTLSSPQKTLQKQLSQKDNDLMKNMKTERQYIFQVNPGSIRHFFTKSEKAKSIPDTFKELICHCSECGENFTSKKEDVEEIAVMEPFVTCPNCHCKNHLFCIDDAIETGRLAELSQEIKNLEFQLKMAKGNERLPNDLRNLNLKDKAVSLFIEMSKILVEKERESYENTEKCKILTDIADGVEHLGATRETELLEKVKENVKSQIADEETIDMMLKVLENSSAYISNVSTNEVIPKPVDSPPPPHSSPRGNDEKVTNPPPIIVVEEKDIVENKPQNKDSVKRSSSRSQRSQKSASVSKSELITLQKEVLVLKNSFSRIRDALLVNKEQAVKLIKSVSDLVKNKISKYEGSKSETAELKKLLTESQNHETDLKLELTRAINALEKLQIEREEQEDKDAIIKKMQEEHEQSMYKLNDDFNKLQKKLNDSEKVRESLERKLQKIAQNRENYNIENNEIFSIDNTQQQTVVIQQNTSQQNLLQNTNFTKQNSSKKITVPKTPRTIEKQEQKQLTLQQRFPLLVYDNNDNLIDPAKPHPVVYVTNVQEQQIPPKPMTPKQPIVDTVPDQTVLSKTAQDKYKISLQEQIKQQKTQQQIDLLSKRIKSLEKSLEEKTNELSDYREKSHEYTSNAFKQKQDFAKVNHELTKERMLHASTVSRLNKALQLLEDKNKTIEKYRRLNDQFSVIASIASAGKRSDDKNDILKVFSAFGSNPFLANMERNEVRSLERWIAVRDEILQRERTQEIKRLDALCLILKEKGGHTEKQPLVNVTPMKN
ncbi:hypothetical protein TVAG_394210 [Trichomonas vaginalis G3]|uniref:Uncharacterized protein n=1 Tax=Trichomonas vaginalis (strain ATCC PRA-98 / G3) TaxID=412133 RepID=A2DWD8_TRIV3|nr:hypothetical protein TVAGG3_0278870 [Trichomonas vaginalis G3]EAY15278.1 hypothetical protein TVAG_394210 [Trichomonas vaginalis G3]KAI5526403.1 hypothetical protein TVAGG3_0278870 [Trichomonas vaginalis G3]|eukprot:XP_001327501.1 hypothetical protein [Trichomonas vaginalis G3]